MTDRERALEWAFAKQLPGRHKAVLLTLAWNVEQGSDRATIARAVVETQSGIGGDALFTILDDLIAAGFLRCEGPRPGAGLSGQLQLFQVWFVGIRARN